MSNMENNLFDIQVHDGLVPKDFQKELWEYLREQTWHVFWLAQKETPGRLDRFKPKDGYWARAWPVWPRAGFHRCCIATDENTLKDRHPIISTLWETINAGLDNQYEITGNPEEMYDREYSSKYGVDGEGWRVYVNGTVGQINAGTWGPHRDTPNLEDDTSVTIIYCLNLEWYPRFGGEFIFFPEDPDGSTGDHQQFNVGAQQQRGFNIGWADKGRLVSPIPGRILVYDGRCLHTTYSPSTTSQSDPFWRVVFRARRKTNVQ